LLNPIDNIRRRIQAARGEIEADLVLRNGRVLNVFDGTVQEADVAVQDGFVAGLGYDLKGKEEFDADGMWIAPGLMDAHIHIESTMLKPARLAAALLPHGTVAIVADPHEIANVMGLTGIRLLLDTSLDLPFDIFFMAPSCVPASRMETSGARLEAKDLMGLLDEPRVLGLAEMMNFPGLIHAEPAILDKIELFRNRVLDGHCPGLSGLDLQAYVGAGIGSDHECTTVQEAREKVRAGMFIMIREGTSAHNLDALLPAVTPESLDRFCFVSDDLHPQDIMGRGHLNHMIRRAVEWGMSPVNAVRLASLNPARYFGFRDRGAVAPGYRADLVVLTDPYSFSVGRVYKNGLLVVEHGRVHDLPESRSQEPCSAPIAVGKLDPELFFIPDRGGRARIIRIVPGQIYTEAGLERPLVKDGRVSADVVRDILTLAVVERHHATGNIGLGLVQGFGLEKGALVSSVAHDSHNIIAVGTSETDIHFGVEAISRMGGGLAVVGNGEVLARVPLPIGGLISEDGPEELVRQLRELNLKAASLGCSIKDPFMLLSFLALPVIPAIKLTDKGLVDVFNFEFVPLFPDA